VTWSQPQSENERQQSVNDFVCCILYHPRALLWHLSTITVLAAFMGKIVNVDVASPDNERQQSVNRASTERQQSVNRASTERQQSVNRASTERQQSVNRVSTECQQSVNRASTERQQSVNRVSTEHQQSINRASTERQHSINHLGCCILYDSRAVLRHLPIINALAAFVGKREGDMVTAPV